MSTTIDINKAPETANVQTPTDLPFTPQQSFVQRLVNVTVTFGAGNATGQPTNAATAGGSPGGITGGTSVVLSGSRTTARISNAGGLAGSGAEVWVYGLTQTLLNQCSTLGLVYNSLARNQILVTAGDAVSGMVQVFQGQAVFAYPDYNRMPDVPMYFLCQSGAYNQVGFAKPASFTGSTDVATMMQGFATKLGVGFENNGVNVKLSNPYYPSNVWTQMRRTAEHANINASLVDGGATLAIWPKGGSRTSQTSIPLVSPGTGMIGYPSFSQNTRMVVKMIFNPQVKLGVPIQVQSSIPSANGMFTVWKYDLVLESKVPHGQWMGVVECFPFGQSPPPPQGG